MSEPRCGDHHRCVVLQYSLVWTNASSPSGGTIASAEVLILLLCLGVGLSTPLPPSSTHRSAPSSLGPNDAAHSSLPTTLISSATPAGGSPITQTKSHDYPVVVIHGARQNAPEEEGASVSGATPELSSSSSSQNGERNSKGFFGSVPALAQRPIQDRVVMGEVKMVALSVGKQHSSQNSFVPPLVFAQKMPDINMEPTEVEAPGTTPTTVAMVMEPLVLTNRSERNESKSGQSSHLVPLKSDSSKTNQTNFKVKEIINTDETKSLNGSLSELTINTFHTEKTTETEEVNYKQKDKDFSDPKLTKDVKIPLEDTLQSDDPSVSASGNLNKSEQLVDNKFKDFKIRAINNTYTLIHEKTYPNSADNNSTNNKSEVGSLYNSSSPKQDSITQENVYKNKNSEINGNESNLHVFSSNTSLEETTPDSNGSLSSRQSKKIGSELQPVSNDPAKEVRSRVKDSETIEKSSNSSITGTAANGTEQVERELFTLMSKEHTFNNNSGVNSKETSQQQLLETRENVRDGYSNIATREVDNNSFFVSVDARLASRKVKKDDVASPRSQSSSEEGTYRMGVITSSSEVSYKQFDPKLKNSSITDGQQTFESSSIHSNFTPPHGNKYSSFSKAERDSPGEGQLSRNYTKYLNDDARLSSEVNGASDQETKRRNISTDDRAVTSLPSQTSVVEPIRASSSSSLGEVTLPSSHHRTKSGHKVTSHPVSSPISADIIQSYPLGGAPEGSSGSLGQADPLYEQVHGSISAGAVTGIVVAVLLMMALAGGAVTYLVQRRLEGFRPKILSSDRSCANSDSGGYLDDQCRVAYVNSQIDLPKSTSEDLVSLDNDSFLNSLESMTIQNLWTDSIRHTKL